MHDDDCPWDGYTPPPLFLDHTFYCPLCLERTTDILARRANTPALQQQHATRQAIARDYLAEVGIGVDALVDLLQSDPVRIKAIEAEVERRYRMRR